MYPIYYSRVTIQDEHISEGLIVYYALKKSDRIDPTHKDISFFLKGVEAREQGLAEINNRHYIVLDKNKYQQVYSTMYQPQVMELAVKMGSVEKARLLLKEEILDPTKEFANRLRTCDIDFS